MELEDQWVGSGDQWVGSGDQWVELGDQWVESGDQWTIDDHGGPRWCKDCW